MSRPTAASLILHFLRHVGISRLDRISRYMDSQWNTPASTTRNTLSRLCIAGRVERVGRAKYQIPVAGAGQADNETSALGH